MSLKAYKQGKILKNGPSKICGRKLLNDFTQSVLEYFVPNSVTVYFQHAHTYGILTMSFVLIKVFNISEGNFGVQAVSGQTSICWYFATIVNQSALFEKGVEKFGFFFEIGNKTILVE